MPRLTCVVPGGLAHTAGLLPLRREGRRAETDAEAVRRVRAAGAIPVLVSNCPELCMFFESYNGSVGTTRNPHDTRRTPGGSSGGEAALLAAGASVIGIGSDIGGSLRLPAMFTGVFGHKPTAGIVSDIGHLPRSDDTDWWRFFSVGPMTRYAQDLPLMLKLMVKDEVVPSLKLDENVDVSQLRIFYIEEVETYSSLPVNSDVISGLHRAVDHLKIKCKIEPQKIYIKELKDLFSIMLTCLFSLEGLESVFQTNQNPKERKNPSVEWLKKIVGLSDFCAYSLLYAPLKFLFGNLPKNIRTKYIELIGKIRTQLEDILKDDGVLLIPTFCKPAVFHGEMYSYFMNGTSCFIFNCTQMPATNCPVGRSKEGLPIGIQIGASRFQDRLSIAVAQELENALGGWIKP
ncbi:Glutamyl-tRNA(Gln) amidotransferase subunit A, mitochondrial [Gryllus bimaculatus]|nr:Glutamyl-tRNA(Gln) amidotransferase subunit A, mitochondrial [Gryllus bimaculatus]